MERHGRLVIRDALPDSNPPAEETLKSCSRPNAPARLVQFPGSRKSELVFLDGTVKLWDVVTGKERASLKVHEAAVVSLAFSPDNTLLASGRWDNSAKLMDAKTGQPKASIGGHGERILSVAFSTDGKLMATGGGDIFGAAGEMMLWDTATALAAKFISP
jgi:WD40 repeat protein